MDEGLKEIYHAFDGKLVGRSLLKIQVCKTVSLLQEKVVAYVTRNCWFLGSMDEAWAFTFTGNDLKGQHLIFLSDELLEQNEQQMQYSICHEIGHVMLGHRNSVTVPQTKAEIKKQEREADDFAQKYVF